MMYLAFKKEATSFFGKLIKGYTFSKYCHAELVFSDDMWFSAREFTGGTQFVKGPPPNERYSMYDFIELPIDVQGEARIRKWCEGETGCNYDVRGVLFSFLPIPIGWQSAEKWFCSEICCAALQIEGWFKGYSAASVSPRKLYNLTVAELPIKQRLASVGATL